MARPPKNDLANTPHPEQSDMVARDVEEFLARGGKIKQIPRGVGFMNTADGKYLLGHILTLPGTPSQG